MTTPSEAPAGTPAPAAPVAVDPPAAPAAAPAPVAAPAAGPAPAGAPADGPAAPPAAPAPSAAPTAYQPFTVGEGKAVDAQLSDKAVAFAKANGLDQAGAQRHYEALSSAMDGVRARAAEQVNAWKAEAAKDPEIGGDKAATVSADMSVGLEKFGSAGFRDLLTQTGLIEHPEVRRTFAKLGRATQEGGGAPLPQGNGAASPEATPEKRMYPGFK